MGRFASGDILDRSKAFALRAIRLVRAMPRDIVAKHIGQQLLRSATSIGANLHEADMAETARDFCNKVNVAQKEAGESTYWIGLIRDAQILSPRRLAEFEAEAIELRKICRQIVKATRQSTRPRK